MPAPNPDAEPDLPDDDLPDDAFEARWADIVAQLGPLDERAAADPAGDEPRNGADDAAASPAPDTAGPARTVDPGPRDWPATPEVEELEETESHFLPPDPEPVLSRDPLLTLAWSLVVGIPVLVVVGVVVRAAMPVLRIPAWSGPVAGVLFLVGLGVLLWRMPHRRDPDDHGTGAVV
ncbi:hypothetical protein [Krasilnikoviella flava]|uniref:DUF308 domain-containing protein n=1 Tax=Krasilnikoviella flava TaxID=526729 RepID=A0A1T5LAH6_9MICO|nr:hypothetical protein [Krasilnikoviella flava]SKC72953.1 hypothetical protein SAMN04324258_3244 [Krasilnikoviella flava]